MMDIRKSGLESVATSVPRLFKGLGASHSEETRGNCVENRRKINNVQLELAFGGRKLVEKRWC